MLEFSILSTTVFGAIASTSVLHSNIYKISNGFFTYCQILTIELECTIYLFKNLYCVYIYIYVCVCMYICIAYAYICIYVLYYKYNFRYLYMKNTCMFFKNYQI